MVSATSIRQAISASHHSISRKAPRPHSSRRPMVTTSAMSLPLDDQPTIDLHIFDIFDAPSRLGESSKLLARAASLASSRSERTMSTSTATSSCQVAALPSPILFDGPARPRYLAHGTLRARRTHSHARTHLAPREPVSPLPPPIIFDGPSCLRPYVRGGSSSGDSPFSPKTLFVVAATGVIALTGYNKFKEDGRTLNDRYQN